MVVATDGSRGGVGAGTGKVSVVGMNLGGTGA